MSFQRVSTLLIATTLLVLPGCSRPPRPPDLLDAGDPSEGIRFPALAPVYHGYAQPAFDVLSTDLDLRIEPHLEVLDAAAHVEVRALRDHLDALSFDMGELRILDIQGAGGDRLEFNHREQRLTIELGRELQAGERAAVRIAYRGHPAAGMYFRHTSAGTVVFTHGQPARNHHWFPCVDAPFERVAFSLRLSVPEDFAAVGPGKRVDTSRAKGWRTDTWRMDFEFPAYLLGLCIGPLGEIRRSSSAAELGFFFAPAQRDAVAKAFATAAPIYDFLCSYTDCKLPWGWVSHSVVSGLPAGAMENIGHVIFEGERVLVPEEYAPLEEPVHIIAHEAAHQWFGDLVGPRTWGDLWISEGFASYFHLLYLEKSRGEVIFRRWMRANREDAMRADRGLARRPILSSRYALPLELFDGHAYGGAAWRLHMLRRRLGDAPFQSAVRRLLRRYRGSSISSSQALGVFAEEAGESLDDFVEQWFRWGGHPEVDVRWKVEPGAGELAVELEQSQVPGRATRALYTLNTTLLIGGPRGLSARYPVAMDRRRLRLVVHPQFAPRWVRLDPEDDVYMVVRVHQPLAADLDQLRDDPDPFGRGDALAALARRWRAGELKGEAAATLRQAIARALAGDPSFHVREAAARAAGRCADALLVPPLAAALGDARAEVRRAAVRALGESGEKIAAGAALKGLLAGGEDNPLVRAAALEALGRLRAPGSLSILQEILEKGRSTIALEAALRGLAALVDERSRAGGDDLWRIEPFLGAGRPGRLRAQAIRSFEKMTRRASGSRWRLEGWLRDPDRRVRLAALESLDQRADPASLPALILAWRAEHDDDVRLRMLALGRKLNRRADVIAAAAKRFWGR